MAQNKLLFGGVRAETKYWDKAGNECSPEEAYTAGYYEYDENDNLVGTHIFDESRLGVNLSF